MTGKELYDTYRQRTGPTWEQLTAVERRWWNLEAAKPPRPKFTWPQRLAIWALAGMVCWGAIAGLVGLVWYLVSRW